MEMLSPARSKGTRFLQTQGALWMYSPLSGSRTTLRLSPRESFQGSVFSNNDMSDTTWSNDYAAGLLGSASVDHPDFGRVEAWVISGKALRRDVPDGEIRLYLRKDGLLPLRVEYYAKSGLLLKTMELSDYALTAGRLRPRRMVMTAADGTGERSTVLIGDLREKTDLPGRHVQSGMARTMRAVVLRHLCCLGLGAVAGSWTGLHAETGSGVAFAGAGTVATYVEAAYPETPGGAPTNPAVTAACQSDLRLSAQTQSLLFRLGLRASAEGTLSSAIVPPDGSEALLLEVREAETTLLPDPEPGAPRRHAPAEFRHRGLRFPGQSLRQRRRARSGRLLGAGHRVDSRPRLLGPRDPFGRPRGPRGVLFGPSRISTRGAPFGIPPGALDSAGRRLRLGGGQRGAAAGGLPLPVRPELARLAGGGGLLPHGPSTKRCADRTSGGGGNGVSESLRFELRKSVEVGEISLELGAAYRGIYPAGTKSRWPA